MIALLAAIALGVGPDLIARPRFVTKPSGWTERQDERASLFLGFAYDAFGEVHWVPGGTDVSFVYLGKLYEISTGLPSSGS